MRLLVDFCENVLFEERVNGFGRNGIKLVVNCNAHALLALAHTESAAQLQLILNFMLCDQMLELFHDLSGTLDMAGTADTNRNFHL